MILSKKIISNFIPTINLVPNEKVIEALIAIGCEVEQVIESVKTDFLKIGKIVAIKKHPHAAKLTICKVQLEETQFTEIVCGAKNVTSDAAINKYAIVALEGAQLSNGRIVGTKNIRGVISEGMLCAYQELNTNSKNYVATEDADNIILLEDAKPFDTEIDKYINSDDTMFLISLPTNRPDWQGARFISQELAAYLKLKYIKKIDYSGEAKFNTSPIQAINGSEKNCKYFGGIYLRNKKIKSSSWNLKGLLINNQIKPDNDINDYMALISLLIGNSIQVYDADKIVGSIKVRTAASEEKMIGADGKTYNIEIGDLIVVDNEKTLGLAGIIGTEVCKVTQQTSNFFIEIGNFNHKRIQKTVERLQISTLASQINSKEVPLYATQLTFDYVYEYLTKDNVAQQISKPTKKLNLKKYHHEIVVDFKKIVDLLGYNKNLSELKIRTIWTALGFSVTGNKVLVPTYRNDVEVWEDLAEELVKVLNINTFAPEPIKADYILNQDNHNYEMLQTLSAKLQNLQISNIHTYNLTTLKKAKQFTFFDYGEPMRVRRPLSSDHEYFQLNVINNLLDVLKYNKDRKNALKPLFEIKNIMNLEHASVHIGIVLPTPLFKSTLTHEQIPNNLLTMKGLSEVIVNNFGFNCDYEKIKESPFLIENDALKLIVYQEIIGYIGRIRPSLLKEYDLDHDAIYALDINLDPLIKSLNRTETNYEPVSKFQNVERDITFQVLNNDDFDHFAKTISKIKEVKKWELISVFNPSDAIASNQATVDKLISSPNVFFNQSLFVTKNNPTIDFYKTSKSLSSEIIHESTKITITPEADIEFIKAQLLEKLAPTKYTVRYYIAQNHATLTTEEINEINKKIFTACLERNIFIDE